MPSMGRGTSEAGGGVTKATANYPSTILCMVPLLAASRQRGTHRINRQRIEDRLIAIDITETLSVQLFE